MPTEPATTPRPYGGIRFHSRQTFLETLPFIADAECAVVTAERAGYTFNENAERTEALRVRLSDPFLSGVKTFVFDCRLVESRGVQPRDRLGRYLFVARQPAYKVDPAESAVLDRLVKKVGAFNKVPLIFLPWANADEPRGAMSCSGKSNGRTGYLLESFGSVTFDATTEQVRIEGPDKKLVFEVTSAAPVIMSSMVTAYLFRTLKRREYPGRLSSDMDVETAPRRPLQRPRKRFSWSGECATKTMRYGSGTPATKLPDGGRT